MRLPRPFLVMVLAPSLAGCTIEFGGKSEACGRYPAGGGPAEIVTQDEEVCEVVRLRVLRQLDHLPTLTRETIDRLIDRTLVWEGTSSLDRLYGAVRKDGGDELATELERAVGGVTTRSARPLPPECAETERCFVKGAAKGLRLALLSAQPTPVPATPPATPK